MFAVYGNHGWPDDGTIKEMTADGNAPSEFDGLCNLQHRRPYTIAKLRSRDIVEAQSQQSGALASGGLGEGDC